MVIVKLLGGLGNQMFQYATGCAVAQRLGVQLLLDVRAFEQYDLRRYELGEWAIRARVARPDELAQIGVAANSSNWISRMRMALGCHKHPFSRFIEASFGYDPDVLHVTAPVYLDGYWQSERYFSDIAELLRQEFVLKQNLVGNSQRMATRIADVGAKAVSLHIRRGDYVSNPHTAQYHGVCSLEYYQSAVDYIASRVSSPHFFVFSDDLAWVSKNLKLSHANTLVDANGADKGVWDMALMKACRHHVVANSTFSWWGAWLNSRPEKIVVAPERWFNGASHDTSDLIPSAWVRL